jgi:hypothetical protein
VEETRVPGKKPTDLLQVTDKLYVLYLFAFKIKNKWVYYSRETIYFTVLVD